MQDIRQPAVAGQFYPAEAEKLKERINTFLNEAEAEKLKGKARALMVPHAGYDFSGPVAAYAYKHLKGKEVRHVYILGNSHSSFFEGVAVDDSSAWRTPLGQVNIDQEVVAQLEEAYSSISVNEASHKGEHSLEVQVPFLQTVLSGDFSIIPILFGNTAEGDDYKQLARAITQNIGKKDVVIISSDMSHFPPYEEANRIDQKTLEIIASGDIEELENHVSEVMEQGIPNEDTLLCGEDAVKTGMELAHLLNWDTIKELKYANSGDNPMVDKDRVVGYGAVIFADSTTEEEDIQQQASQAVKNNPSNIDNPLSPEQRQTLLNIARETVEKYVRIGQKPEYEVKDERLQETEGAFVTIKKNGELRGCI
ncbi:MAG TPA: AmmeMemoRadiSam system protein B, partial [Patescibacteria group bacterium]|nr:AmmeMemoRadiSam system protein B [Patescibacteria group bacterium]